jgi:hypothetical protein
MDNEIIEPVLTEILEEIKTTNGLNKEYNLALKEQKNRLVQIQETLLQKDEYLALLKLVHEKITTLSNVITQQPSPAKREFRILLFPEYNTVQYYKIVFGRVIFWLVILCVAKYLYLFGHEWINKYYDDRRYQKAWNTLYEKQEKQSQKFMESVLSEY